MQAQRLRAECAEPDLSGRVCGTGFVGRMCRAGVFGLSMQAEYAEPDLSAEHAGPDLPDKVCRTEYAGRGKEVMKFNNIKQ